MSLQARQPRASPLPTPMVNMTGTPSASRRKRTPNLNFYYDLGQDAVDRVEELLGEIAEENAGRPPE